jgi:hypothetical protein
MGIDEAARRRADFRPGQPLVMRDGQAWSLRLPSLRVTPDFRGPEVVVRVGPEGVPDYDELAAILYGETRVPAREYWAARFRVGSILLRANYDLGDAELAALLSVVKDDPEDEGRLQVIEDTFLGRLPEKPAPAGSN